MYNGLSLDQAPPISVVSRFFLSVPLFGIALCAVVFLFPSDVLLPGHPAQLASIHLMFLGVLAMGMIGSLFQMQSVLGGRAIPAPLGNAFLIHLLLSLGIAALAGAFLGSAPVGFVFASVLLGSAVVYTAFLVLPLLFSASSNDTLRGMRLALISLLFTALAGVAMAQSYANGSFSEHHAAIRSFHYSFGLIGWVATLIIAVAFQVVEMFYVTPSYHPGLKRNVFRALLLFLAFKTLMLSLDLPYAWVADIGLSLLLAGFAAATVRKLHQRKRRVSDVSIWFWNTSMGLLALSLVARFGANLSDSALLEGIALIAFALFALGVILGMMGKIVSFLVWFHLNAAGYMETPIMSNVIPAARTKALYTLFAAASSAALIAPIAPIAMRGAAVLLGALFALLGYNLVRSLMLYRHVRLNGTRFDFPPLS